MSQIYSAWGLGSTSEAGANKELSSVVVGYFALIDMEALCV